MKKRIAVGGIVHETNTFVPSITSLSAFTVDAGDQIVKRWQGTFSSLGGVLQGLADAHNQPIPLSYASAMPSGKVAQAAYQTLLDELIQRLRTAAPLDGVLLVLHGAMVAEDQDDCEGEILRKVRAEIGPDCPLVSVLDMHGSLTGEMVAAANVLLAFNQNPHLDTFDRGLEAAALLERLLETHVTPTSVWARPPLLLNALMTSTARLPLSAVHDQASVFRQDERVLNISIMGGFAYSDVVDAGVSVLVTTDNDEALAHEMARALVETAWQHREAARIRGVPVETAVRQAINAAQTPVILADIGDNVGGGSPGDGTVILRALIESDAQDAVIVLADPEAVSQAVDAGTGAAIDIWIGGKSDHWHGEPVRVKGIVEHLSDGRFTTSGKDHFANIYGRTVEMGQCARLRCDGITILLTERKTPPGDLEQLRSQGIYPEAQRIIVVKSAIAFRGAYEPIAGEIIEVNTPGLCAASLDKFLYQKLRRPLFPLDELDFNAIDSARVGKNESPS